MACGILTRTGALRVQCASTSEARRASIICPFRGCDARLRARVLLQRRQFSRSRVTSEDNAVETLEVVCGSSGRITVELYNSQALRDPSAPLILYLPPTGAHLRDTHPPIPRLLLAQKNTALAQINYRWNIPSISTKSSSTSASATPNPPLPSSSNLPSSSLKAYPFPVPLHDTLHALDHLTHHLKKYSQPATPPSSPYAAISSPKEKIQRPLLIHGSFLGGTLATSLALTESHTSRSHPYRILGLITQNGVFDWSEVAATKLPPLLSSGLPPSTSIQGNDEQEGNEEQEAFIQAKRWPSEPWTSQILHALKPTLFSSPQSAFDPFASPLLFFRTSGYGIPRRWPGTIIEKPETKPFITSIISDSEDEVVSSPASSAPDGRGYGDVNYEGKKGKQEGEREEEEEQEEGEIGRRYPLKFPPSRSYTNPEADLELPRALFITTTSTPPNQYPSPSPSLSPSTKSNKSIKSKSKSTKPPSKQALKPEQTPHLQALELQSRIYRSIEQQESRRTAQWEEWGNEDLDNNSNIDSNTDTTGDSSTPRERKGRYADSVEDRVKVLEIDLIMDDIGGDRRGSYDSRDDQNENEGENEIRNWIEDVIG